MLKLFLGLGSVSMSGLLLHNLWIRIGLWVLVRVMVVLRFRVRVRLRVQVSFSVIVLVMSRVSVWFRPMLRF